jgi:cytoskeleton protein RodZ
MFAEEFVVQAAAGMSSATVAGSATQMQLVNDGLPDSADLVNLIESQLSQSFVYRRAVESLQQLMANDTTDGQMLLKVVGLEAIRLTLQAVSAQPARTIDNPIAPVTELAVNQDVLDQDVLDQDVLDNDLFEAIANVTQASVTQTNPLSHLINRYKAKQQTAAESVKVFTRAEILTQIGAQIQLEREQKGLTIAQLHARTFIPMYHLQALEGGHVEQLPEDVYLRGFLRRIENALGLAVGSLIDKLPNESIAPSILPSWAGHGAQGQRRGIGGLDINPTHLYVTYAAIMAGGVCWLSNQSTPTAANLPDLTNYEPRAAAESVQMQASRPKANLADHKIGNAKSNVQAKSLKVGSVKNIAPPETLR